MKSIITGMRKTPLLHPELSAGVHELRGALTELLGDVGADVRRPQELARKLSLDRSLAWRLSRTVSAGDPQNALQYMPGDAALNIVLRAVKGAGGGAALRQRAEGAIKNFQTAVQRHLGDRPTLDLVIDGLPSENGDQLSVSRKLAFRGNSGILGVQAKARFHTVMLAPNRDRPEMIDCGLIGGWVDFRRIRGDARWVLFRRSPVGDVQRAPNQDEPMDLEVDPSGPALMMKEFCSQAIPDIHTRNEDGVLMDELGPSTIGNSGAFTCVFGSITRAIGPRKADGPEDQGRFRVSISAPVETLQFDMLVHRECEFALDQTIKTYCGFATSSNQIPERDLLPIHATRTDLGAEPPAVQTALFPRYAELTERAFARMGYDRSKFIGIRYEIAYPPFPSTVAVTFPLETADVSIRRD
jgi:hypothetical protein